LSTAIASATRQEGTSLRRVKGGGGMRLRLSMLLVVLGSVVAAALVAGLPWD
jgi:hypothetical protein